MLFYICGYILDSGDERKDEYSTGGGPLTLPVMPSPLEKCKQRELVSLVDNFVTLSIANGELY